MNSSGSKRKPKYLEDLRSSIEYLFAMANIEYVSARKRISYFEAFNQVGQKIFEANWTDREFFARRGSSDVAAFQEEKKLSYSLFESKEFEDQCSSRVGYAEYPILNALSGDELHAYYINHHTGEEVPLDPSFWRSQKSSFTRITGTFKNPDRNKLSVHPGRDFIVIFDLKDFKGVIKSMPKKKPQSKLPPNKSSIEKANKRIESVCKQHGVVINRAIYASALNHLLDTDYFHENSIRLYWKDTFLLFRNKQGVKGALYLSLEML